MVQILQLRLLAEDRMLQTSPALTALNGTESRKLLGPEQQDHAPTVHIRRRQRSSVKALLQVQLLLLQRENKEQWRLFSWVPQILLLYVLLHLPGLHQRLQSLSGGHQLQQQLQQQRHVK